MNKPGITLFFLGGLAMTLIMIVLSLSLGAEPLDWSQVKEEWGRPGPLAEKPMLSVLLMLRLPRTLAALLAGCGLAVAGCAFQALLRNPLATPYTLGVASASAFGAWMAFILLDAGWVGASLLGLPIRQAGAFVCAGANVLLVYFLAVRPGRTSPAVLLLAGVALGMLFNSGILFTRYLASPTRLVAMDRWLMGGVDVIGYNPVFMLALGVIPCTLLLLLQAPKFDQFAFGEALAQGRGVNILQLQRLTFLIGSLLTAIIVSEVGPIGFIGLIIPHAVRTLTGPGHRHLMPLSALLGACFLCASDIIARTILPGETPIGIITTLVGAPCFLYLLMGRRFTDWSN